MLPRIFDLFMPAGPWPQRMQGGLGAGLTLVRGIVELHGGTVDARSQGTNRGSEFTIRLPGPGVPGPPPAERPKSFPRLRFGLV